METLTSIDQETAQLHSQIWTELSKLDPEQRRSVELAGLQAMRDRIAQRVQCLTKGVGCEPNIGGIDFGWF